MKLFLEIPVAQMSHALGVARESAVSSKSMKQHGGGGRGVIE